MKFKKDSPLYSSEVQREGGEDILYINYQSAREIPSLADSPEAMERTLDALIENPNVSRIVFVQNKNYNYDLTETSLLLEIAQLYIYFLRQENILGQKRLITSLNCQSFFTKRYNQLFSFLFSLRRDPIVSYFEIKRFIIDEQIMLNKVPAECKSDQESYIYFLGTILQKLEATKLISRLKGDFGNYSKGDREIYKKVFSPDVIPNFTFTRLVEDLPAPKDSELVDEYEISFDDYDVSRVSIFRKKGEAKLLYHLEPPENSLEEQYSELLNLARGVLIEHQPKAEEFTDTERTRQVFFNISKDLLQDLASARGIAIDYKTLNLLSKILVRHTIGFGLLEILLQDENLQDITLNAPIPQTNVFVRHQKYDECSSNILPSQEDADSWAAKFRMLSGRPLDEANPILDTQVNIGNIRARVAAIQQPLSPDGIAYAFRRHRENPWTLSLFIKNKMINPLAAGLLSFLVDGSRTLIVAGTRSSGKTSLLGSLMQEIIPRYRVIVVEDSLELPVESLRKLKYDILRMKVRSSLLKTTTEVSAEEGIRTSLRLGDSCLIIGEVRSTEAKALYEAMRVGALANVVAGTIHGASPYGVFDRVVNDLGVQATSFKATDIIIVANVIKSADGLSTYRRVVQITEVRKHWTKDPLAEGGFVDLMKYDVEEDELKPSEDLINGESEIIKDIAGNVKGWAGNWDAVWDNILLRAEMKQELVDVAEKDKMPEILEADFNVLSNDYFHKISEKVRKESAEALPLKKYVFPKWKKWLEDEIKGRKK